MKHITLYTKLDCHLCEEAYQVLFSLFDDISMNINVVDIARTNNQATQKEYGVRIPVLAQPDRPDELDWPFTANDIKAYLAD